MVEFYFPRKPEKICGRPVRAFYRELAGRIPKAKYAKAITYPQPAPPVLPKIPTYSFEPIYFLKKEDTHICGAAVSRADLAKVKNLAKKENGATLFLPVGICMKTERGVAVLPAQSFDDVAVFRRTLAGIDEKRTEMRIRGFLRRLENKYKGVRQ